MGYKDSPRIFTKLTKPILATLREQNVQIMMYIEDALIVHDSFDSCEKATSQSLSLMKKLGFHVSEDKSSLIPRHQINYLGFTLNSIDMSVQPADKKVIAIKNQIKAILLQSHMSIRDLAEITLKLNDLTPGNRYGTVFCKLSEIQKNAFFKENLGNYNSTVCITSEMREDLEWWRDHADKFPVLPSPRPPPVNITADASKSGWGGVCDGVTTSALWSKEEQALHINCLELKAALLSIKAFVMNENNCFIHLLSDIDQCYHFFMAVGNKKTICLPPPKVGAFLFSMGKGSPSSKSNGPVSLSAESI
ncbi:reverse transcriptase [Elysia marginata]|uniref:Reverse transcriptase n=1 Tax=Elysia marginata TaxID=1093978 RepID=A0AAV4EEM3_9GAST|nr:reverse transcriptase [Elysia marginata]